MTEAKKTAEKKAASAKKPEAPKAAKKETAPKAKPASAPKAEKPKAAPKQKYSGATLKVVQIGSPIGRTKDQEGTLIGLGLNKLNRTRELPDTPEVRGMISKVQHLVKVVN